MADNPNDNIADIMQKSIVNPIKLRFVNIDKKLRLIVILLIGSILFNISALFIFYFCFLKIGIAN